ncbi:MAG: DUF58 domain-containing protein [Gemmataceae bacterium]
MLTPRGWWFLLFVVTFLAMGAILALRGVATILLLGLTLFLWFVWEWAQFAIQARLATRNLTLTRRICDERGSVTTLWAGQSFTVQGCIQLGGAFGLTAGFGTDRPPVGANVDADADLRHSLPTAPGHEVAWTYRIHCTSPGTARFEGARIQIADAQGFFYFNTFLRVPAVLPILPTLVDAEAKQRATKRFNLLPPPGVHRHRRPGSGSELLELRDYRPGDPPKRIAWKVSARKDKLITREFESEVPLRCTLFVDTSDSVRLGPPGRNSLTQLVAITATVAQAAIANRDLVGLALCDERTTGYAAPARTPAHSIDLLHRLARVAALAPATEAAEVTPLLERAYPFACEVYPDLTRASINRFPMWLTLLTPQPGWTRRRPMRRDAWLQSMRLLSAAFFAAGSAVAWAAESSVGVAAAAAGATLFALSFVGGFIWNLLSRRERRYSMWRKRLAALIATCEQLPFGAIATMSEDDAACAAALQRFLAAHQVPYDVPLYDARGRYLFARPAKVDVLAKALLRAVGRGRDNELFVVLADLLELDDDLSPLVKAVRVARARHHQILVVCPWPAGLDLDAGGPPALPSADASPAEIVRLVAQARARRAWTTVRRSFGRLGVPVLSATVGDPARLILHRLEQLRTLQGAGRE